MKNGNKKREAPWDQWLFEALNRHTAKKARDRIADWLLKNASSNAEKRLLRLVSVEEPAVETVARGLIECGANARAVSESGETPLICAARHLWVDCVMFLAPLSDAKAQDQFGETALMGAAARGGKAPEGSLACVKLLLPHSDPLAQNKQGDNALILSVRAGGSAAVAPLLWEAAARAANFQGETALMAAVNARRLAVVKSLLPISDALAKENDGWTALMIAAASGQPECLLELLPASDAKATDNVGRNALMHAAAFGHLDCLEALISRADLSAADNQGRDAVAVALENGQPECAALIERHALAAIAANGVPSAPLTNGAGMPSENLASDSPKKGLLRL